MIELLGSAIGAVIGLALGVLLLWALIIVCLVIPVAFIAWVFDL